MIEYVSGDRIYRSTANAKSKEVIRRKHPSRAPAEMRRVGPSPIRAINKHYR